MSATIGKPCPDFTLSNHDKTKLSLSDLKGHKALVVFIPFAFTGICEGELCKLRDERAALNTLDAKVVVITCQAGPSNGAWAKQNDFTFPVLSDYWPHGAVSQAFGCFNEAVGCANRFTYVLDADGVVRDIINTDSLGTAREYDAYAAALKTF